MLSVFPASQSAFDDQQPGHFFPLSDFDSASWDVSHELIPEPEPIISDPYSFESNQNSRSSLETNHSSPNSADSNQNNPNQDSPNQNYALFGSVEPNNELVSLDPRKLKRMKSNRESARRSRMRKQRHLENLRAQVCRLSVTNRELSNSLRFILYKGQLERSENERLRSEHSRLRRRLIELQNSMIFWQTHQQRMHNHNDHVQMYNNNTSLNSHVATGSYGLEAGMTMMINEPAYLIT